MSFFPQALAASSVRPGPALQWEEPNCLLCGAHNWSGLVEGADGCPGGTGMWFAVVQCQECGLCFTNPRPSLVSISHFYPREYPPHQSPRPRRRHGWQRLVRGHAAGQRKGLYVPAWHGQGRLLDFGCGGGAFLERMHGLGWHVTGLDVCAAAVNRVSTQLRLRAIVGSLPHPELRPESFDVITMWHALEHVHDPLEILREAYRLLVPGGRLLVAVPNIDSLQFRWFGHTWYGLDLPRHLTHFAPWTLQLMLQRAGFRVGPIKMIGRSDWMRRSAKQASAAAERARWRRWLTVRTASRLATWFSSFTRQSDCMTVVAER